MKKRTIRTAVMRKIDCRSKAIYFWETTCNRTKMIQLRSFLNRINDEYHLYGSDKITFEEILKASAPKHNEKLIIRMA